MLQLTLSAGQNAVTPDTINGLALMGLKGLFLLGVLIYFIFSILIIRQIQVMKNTLITPFAPIIQTLGLLHMVAVIIVGFMFWTML